MIFKRYRVVEDFEAMLQQHLARNSGSAISCAGFDTDTASAYVEGSLGAATQLRYEEHLAACAACRHGVIDLFRLMSQTTIIPALFPARSSTTRRLESLWEGLRFPRWRWAMTVGTAACALLFASLFLAYERKQSSSQSDIALNQSASTKPKMEMSPVPRHEGAFRSTEAKRPSFRAASQKEQSAITQEGAAKPLSLPALPATAKLLADTMTGDILQLDSEQAPPKLEAEQSLAEMVAANPSQLLQSADKSEGVLKTQREEQNPAGAIAENTQSGEVKEHPGTHRFVESRRTANKANTRKVRDKMFRFERGVWIDQDFKPQHLLPRVRLERSTIEYEGVLTDVPDLRPFFALGKVVVVWQGKVYEVQK